MDGAIDRHPTAVRHGPRESRVGLRAVRSGSTAGSPSAISIRTRGEPAG